MPRPPDRRPAEGDWLSLGPASRLIGVNADSLRRWADEGRVEVFTTPGGHRRFARRSLDRLVASGHSDRRLPLARLGATPARVSAAYRRSYVRRAGEAGSPTDAVAGPDREAFRRDGRRLVGVLLAYLDGVDSADRARAEAEATEIVAAHAGHLAATGITIDESLGLFVAARRPFLAEIGAVARRRRLEPEQLTTLYDDASGLLDRLLLRFVAAHRLPVPRRAPSRSSHVPTR